MTNQLIPFTPNTFPDIQKEKLVDISKTGKAITTSLKIAEKFGKRHDHVIRDIENLDCPDEFSLPNFGESDYINERGKKYPMYLITRDGFSLLAMGFTGKKAMEWKIKYIAAFNEMEKLLYERHLRRYTPRQIASEVNHIALKVGDIDRKLDCLSEIRQTHNPVSNFALKHCTISLENRISKEEVYYIYTGYCSREGVYALHKNTFFKNLYAHAGYIKQATITASGKRIPAIRGIRLKEVPHAAR